MFGGPPPPNPFYRRSGVNQNTIEIEEKSGAIYAHKSQYQNSGYLCLHPQHSPLPPSNIQRTHGAARPIRKSGAVESKADIPPTFNVASPVSCWMPDNRTMAIGDLRSGTSNLWTLPLFGGPSRQLTHFTSGTIWACEYSPDGKTIVIARGNHQSDAVLFTQTK